MSKTDVQPDSPASSDDDATPLSANEAQSGGPLSFVRALFLFWLMPRRFLPALATGSRRRALAAHLASAAVCLVVLHLACIWVYGPWVASPTELRRATVRWIYIIASTSGDSSFSIGAAILFVGFVPAVELAIVTLGVLLSPAWAEGDDVVSAMKRSVKCAYWNTTVLIPASILTAVAWVLVGDPDYLGVHLGSLRAGIFALLAVAGLFVASVNTSLAAGHFSKTAPRTPPEPHCDECGYLLTGLPADARCPECGLVVRDSLPGGRRRAEAWSVTPLSVHGIVNLLGLQWKVLRNSTVFREIPIHRSAGFARWFWAETLASMAIFVMLGVRAAMSFWPPAGDVSHWIGVSGIAIIAGIFALHAMLLVPVGLFARFACGIRDFRTSTTVWYLLGPLLWPAIAVAMLATPLWIAPWGQWLHDNVPPLPIFGHQITGARMYAIACAIAATAVALFWLLRLRQALQAVRFANT